jgi:hypothetical protein
MKKILVALCFFTTTYAATAQEDSARASRPQKGYEDAELFVGGSLTLSLGGYGSGFLIGVNPYFGYSFTRWLDAGIAVNYQHFSQRDEFDNRYRSNTIGGGIFTRIYPVDFIFLQAQPEFNFTTQRIIYGGQQGGIRETFDAPSLLVGAGYKSSRSDKNNFTFVSLLFDVLKDPSSPYTNTQGDIVPIIRAGVNIGLGRSRRGIPR